MKSGDYIMSFVWKWACTCCNKGGKHPFRWRRRATQYCELPQTLSPGRAFLSTKASTPLPDAYVDHVECHMLRSAQGHQRQASRGHPTRACRFPSLKVLMSRGSIEKRQYLHS